MKRQIVTIILSSLAVVCLTTASVLAQQTTTSGNKTGDQKMMQTNSNIAAPDREFVTKAAEGGQQEVMMAQMAVDKASNPDVKQFAQRLVDDHSKANEELKTLASSKGLTLPAENATKTQKMKNDMGKHSGAMFDREYMKDMIKDHQKDIAMFEREARDGRDSDVKAWAEKTLPTLREHLQMAREVAGKVGVSGMDSNDKGRKGMKDTTKPPQR